MTIRCLLGFHAFVIRHRRDWLAMPQERGYTVKVCQLCGKWKLL